LFSFLDSFYICALFNELKKQIYILVFILILNLPFIGFYTYYQIRKLQIEKNIITEIKNGNLKSKTLEFEFTRIQTQKNITWLSNREFKYSGLVYQVIKVKYSGDKIIYTCRLNQETADLLSNLDSLVIRTLGSNHDTQKAADNLGSFLKCLFSHKLDDALIFYFNVFEYKFNFVKSEYVSICNDSSEPPPKYLTV